MKALHSTILSFLLFSIAFSQSPQAINYQGVARDNNGIELTNKNISLRLSILDGSSTGSAVYSEEHSITTNEFGLFAIQIGQGISVDDFTGIDWGSGTKFLKVEMDIDGGINYLDMGVSQLVSVPYALYAEKAGNTAGNTVWTANPKGATLFNTSTSDDQNTLNTTTREAEIVSDDNDGSTGLRLRDLTGTEVSYSIVATNDQSTLGGDKLLFYHDSGPGNTFERAKMVISEDGVGIGTTTPANHLTISGNANTGDNKNFLGLRNTSSGTGSYVAEILVAGATSHFGTLSHHSENYNLVLGYEKKTLLANFGNGLVLRSLDQGQIEFVTGTDGFDMTTKMLINKQGYVGIGTSTPLNFLSIEGNKSGDDRRFISIKNTSTDTGSSVGMGLYAGSVDGFEGSISHFSETYTLVPNYASKTAVTNLGNGLMLRSFGAGIIEFKTGAAYDPTGLNTKMLLDINGNLGIADLNPASRLTVADGDVYITDNTRGVILTSPNGSCFRVTVDNAGTLTSTPIACP